ncbi:hypothetical protein RF11_01378 [Thelohanellus kitauei]|uniref:Peptidase A2 domain-containing protein n=1 Tax=Thelohanellus kitauei TaxID=669202 RepID=A0A0C2J1T4_THEKT|nr:hypothetical protein RF11_01378 [Thelohanellus kitauei]
MRDLYAPTMSKSLFTVQQLTGAFPQGYLTLKRAPTDFNRVDWRILALGQDICGFNSGFEYSLRAARPTLSDVDRNIFISQKILASLPHEEDLRNLKIAHLSHEHISSSSQSRNKCVGYRQYTEEGLEKIVCFILIKRGHSSKLCGLNKNQCAKYYSFSTLDNRRDNPYVVPFQLFENDLAGMGLLDTGACVSIIHSRFVEGVNFTQENMYLISVTRKLPDSNLSSFSIGEHDLGLTYASPLEINIDESKPVATKPYRVPVYLKPTVENKLTHVLKYWISSDITSFWCSPILHVRKKDDSWRLCIDYLKLNTITAQDHYSIPDIDDILDSTSGFSYYS